MVSTTVNRRWFASEPSWSCWGAFGGLLRAPGIPYCWQGTHQRYREVSALVPRTIVGSTPLKVNLWGSVAPQKDGDDNWWEIGLYSKPARLILRHGGYLDRPVPPEGEIRCWPELGFHGVPHSAHLHNCKSRLVAGAVESLRSSTRNSLHWTARAGEPHKSATNVILDTLAETSATLESLESVSSQGEASPSICNTGSVLSLALWVGPRKDTRGSQQCIRKKHFAWLRRIRRDRQDFALQLRPRNEGARKVEIMI